jgi:hypothetical protein
MLTWKQLTTEVSDSAALSTILAGLSSIGFQATSWQEGSIQLTFWQYVARLYSGFTGYVRQIALAGYPHYAAEAGDDYQDALGEKAYDLLRVAALTTLGEMTLTLSAAAPAASWDAGELVIADAESAPGNSFRVLEAGSLLPGQSASFEVAAEVAGTAGNIGSNSTLYLWTPIVGLSATNPALSGSSTWITRAGQDKEASTRYADRMIGRWSRLSLGTDGAYAAWAKEALPELTRVKVREGTDEGSVQIIGATSTGTLTNDQITTITEYLDGTFDGRRRMPINDDLEVLGATVRTTPTLNLTVTCQAAYASDVAARVSAALTTVFGAIDIGGQIVPPSTTGKILSSKIYQTVMSQTGVLDVSGVPSDFALGVDEVYAPTINVTVVSA